MKIAQLERTNKQLLEKIEQSKEKIDTVNKVEEPTIKKEEKVPEKEEKVVEEKKEVEPPKKETKTLKEIIKGDPEFKRPEESERAGPGADSANCVLHGFSGGVSVPVGVSSQDCHRNPGGRRRRGGGKAGDGHGSLSARGRGNRLWYAAAEICN